jgi:hypothetical protein
MCSTENHLTSCVASRILLVPAIAETKLKPLDLLGISIPNYKVFLEKQFTSDMGWHNRSTWHIDHVVPLMYGNPKFQELRKRFHYSNTRPCDARENRRKRNYHITADDNGLCKQVHLKDGELQEQTAHTRTIQRRRRTWRGPFLLPNEKVLPSGIIIEYKREAKHEAVQWPGHHSSPAAPRDRNEKQGS